jgi:fluoroquinolone resistance protein
MHLEYIEDQTYSGRSFTQIPLLPAEYTGCKFLNCDFSNADISGIQFHDCEFQSCNLSLVTITKTAFSSVRFKQCKMLGQHYEHCSPFGFSVDFEDCMLDHSSFYRVKMKKSNFKGCKLLEVDFTECDLTSAIFENSDLIGATFEQTMLEKADLRSSFNYIIDPERNRLKKARFSLSGCKGLLTKYGILISD